jgi:hypothetical protein
MGRSDGFGRIAPVINHQHRQVANRGPGLRLKITFEMLQLKPVC